MSRVHWLLLLCIAGNAHASALIGHAYLMSVSDGTFRSDGEARFLDDLGNPDSQATLTGEHKVNQVSPAVIFETPVQTTGLYSFIFEGPAETGRCYGTSLHVIGEGSRRLNDRHEETWTGDVRCAPLRQAENDPKSDPQPVTSCDGGTCYGSPIVIAVDGRYEFTSITDGVRFDLDGDGRRDRVAWSRDGSVAFLFFDRNGNGIPDDGRELFGDHTRLRSGERAVHGFEALAEFDSNADGVVSADDDRWTQLQLWRDFDHDGTAGTEEITPVATSGIAALGFDCRRVGRRDAHGNLLRWQALAVFTHGQRPYYDVFLMNTPG